MENNLKKRKVTRKRRVLRVRKKLKGSGKKPRLSVYKSNKNIFAQIIDDEKKITIMGISTTPLKVKNKKEAAKVIGEKIASIAKEKKIKKVVFDRGRFKYHGIIKEFADAARKAGLEF
jgi:large subunit ribosomal protein L18